MVYSAVKVEPFAHLDPGVFELDLKMLTPNMPISHANLHGWSFLSDAGLIMFSDKCPSRRCLFKWVDFTDRFECPCCGSKFRVDGTWISGVASRNLDRYTLWVETPDNILKTSETGGPVSIDDATHIFVDTTHVIPGKPR